MPQPTRIGSTHARVGEVSYGEIEVMPLPTGGVEHVPVVLAQGREEGPCVWVVANIHGSEITGTAVVHTILQRLDCRMLRGTLVVLPTLNPAGMLTGSRTAPYDARDPNRSFPGRRHETEDPYNPSVYEQIASVLFEEIRASADYLLDLHNAHLRSTPYSIRDRVLYRSEAERGEAEQLAERLDGMVRAFGALVINEDLPETYVHKELHRSTAGAALNEARIPAFTAELGANRFVDPAGYEAGVRGVLSVLRWTGLLHDQGEVLQSTHTPYPVRAVDEPRAPASGVVRYLVEPGAHVQADTPLATLSDIWGRPVGDGVVRAEQEGWVVGLSNGSLTYPRQGLASLAVRDEAPLVAPWPNLD